MPRPAPRPKLFHTVTEPSGMVAMMSRFLQWMEATNYGTPSVLTREWHLYQFSLWCQERAIQRPQDVTRPTLERYQRWLFHYRKRDGNPLSFSTQHGRIVALKAFFKWLAKNNHLLANPAADLDLPRREHRLPQLLTNAEIESVLAEPDLRTHTGTRDRAIMETFYSTGIRRKELAELILQSIDRESGTLMVRKGKGKKDRLIPIGDRAVQWIDKYLAEVRPEVTVEPDPGVLFLTASGIAFNPDQLTHIVRAYFKAAGIQKAGACHLFRHAMATAMLENGADVRYVQEMLGHSDLTSTQIYTQVSIRKLKEIHSQTHPAGKGHQEPTVEAQKAELPRLWLRKKETRANRSGRIESILDLTLIEADQDSPRGSLPWTAFSDEKYDAYCVTGTRISDSEEEPESDAAAAHEAQTRVWGSQDPWPTSLGLLTDPSIETPSGISTRGSKPASDPTYTWNDDDRLASAALPNGQTDSFLYDANGIRVGKSDSTGSVRYLIDPLTKAILATYDAGTFLRLFTYNQNPQKVDEVFSYKTAQATKYYPHTDMLGSVYAVSDSTGTSQASWTYDVYGTRTQTSGTLSYTFGFTGREHDGDTGLIYSRARYYDPSVGQWLSKDRIGYQAGPNLYGYVMERPTLFTDPSGQDGWDIALNSVLIGLTVIVAWEVILPIVAAGGAAGAAAGAAGVAGTAVTAEVIITEEETGGAEAAGAEVQACGEYLAKDAPKLVAPGVRYLEGFHLGDLGRVEPWRALYDQFGRLIARVDYNAGNISQGIPEIHTHFYDWTLSPEAATTGEEVLAHIEGDLF